MRCWRLGATVFGLFGGSRIGDRSARSLRRVLAQQARQPLYELVIRRSLGASTYAVAVATFGRAFIAVCAGSAIGVCAALAGSRMLSTILFRTSPDHPIALLGVAAILASAALLAAAGPLWRLATADPAIVLPRGVTSRDSRCALTTGRGSHYRVSTARQRRSRRFWSRNGPSRSLGMLRAALNPQVKYAGCYLDRRSECVGSAEE